MKDTDDLHPDIASAPDEEAKELRYLDLYDEDGPWLGASEAEYTYFIYDIGERLPARFGNYIYARKNDEQLWVPVYMGHGDLSLLCTDAEVLDCIRAKGATHVHARLNSMEEVRVAELHDLLARYENAFPPDGCNSPIEEPALREPEKHG